MRLSKVLPLGMVFPFDFGFVPSTLGDDGDPVDVLVLMDAPAPVGCLVAARLVGVLRCTQRDEGKELIENDRFLAVAEEASTYEKIRDIRDLNGPLLDQIEAFFIQYNALAGHISRSSVDKVRRRVMNVPWTRRGSSRGPRGVQLAAGAVLVAGVSGRCHGDLP